MVIAILVATDELYSISGRRGLAKVDWFEHSKEDHGTVGEHMLQGDMFAGENVPVEVRSFDEEDLVLIPAGDLHPKALGSCQCFRSEHGHLGKWESR